ncbi:YeiH family protein [Halovivax limisalsi]|uniref:YeiH family protein n=1 Tax=Halovivax limisalsi TaxID=1453760 RepID=UPI001FFD1B1E|nr:putative sulfate exporter family transporter [Halovivax limisalsi]
MDDRSRRSIGFALGFLTLVAIAAVAHALAVSVGGSALLLSVAIGFVIANTVGVPAVIRRGVGLHKLFLEVGIVLLGVRLSLSDVASTGVFVVVLAVGVIVLGLVLVELLSRTVFGIDRKTGTLLAAGSSICGVSAAVAVAGSIDAHERQLAYAVATILVFDGLTLLTYPFVGQVLALTPKEFGLWAGSTMFSTGPVTAAGFAHSADAGQWATVTKLVRNAFIGIAAIAYSFVYARKRAGGGASLRGLWEQFPKFLVGFVLVAAVANAGLLGPSQIEATNALTDGLFLLAFAGLGTDIQLADMRDTGIRPILVVLTHLILISVLVLTVVTTLL